VNSCNGLLCLSHPSIGNPLVICNPVTGEFIRLPEATTTPFRLNTARVRIQGQAGFGFQPKTNEYKVIKMWIRRVRRANDWVFERVILEINTLGAPSWRNVEVDPQISISSLKYLTCVNGVLHWIKFEGQGQYYVSVWKVRDYSYFLLLHKCLEIIIIMEFMVTGLLAWES